MIADGAARIINDELLPHEELLWADQPRSAPPGFFYFLAFFALFFVLPFLLPMGYALATEDMTIFDSFTFSINEKRVTSETPVAYLWPAFVGTAIFMAVFVGGCFVWLSMRMSEAYGVTDRRVIIVSPLFGRRVSSINPAMTPYIERSGNQKLGSISFRGSDHGILDKILALYRVRLQSLSRIRNPIQVEALIYERFIEAQR